MQIFMSQKLKPVVIKSMSCGPKTKTWIQFSANIFRLSKFNSNELGNYKDDGSFENIINTLTKDQVASDYEAWCSGKMILLLSIK